jgi:hypothetical protein
MVKCDKCPCLTFGDISGSCNISDDIVIYDYITRSYITKHCPMKKIIFKDGDEYEPEVVDE